MRRILFIILWPAIFWIVTMLAGMLGIGMTWSVIFFGMPALGLILALLGKLPGTRRNKSEAHAIQAAQ
jgi:hypothetical protein